MLYATTIPKQLKKQASPLYKARINPFSKSVTHTVRDRKRGREETDKGVSDTEEEKSEENTGDNSEVNIDEEDMIDSSIPMCFGLGENGLSMLLIVSGSVDGNLVLYNQHSKQENLTYKYADYPNFYNKVVSHHQNYCLMQVLTVSFY